LCLCVCFCVFLSLSFCVFGILLLFLVGDSMAGCCSNTVYKAAAAFLTGS
jgi:hypothetical protein